MTKYKVAQNKTISVDGKDFLFLAADKAIFEMDPATRDLLSGWSDDEELTREEATVRLNGMSDQERDELFQGLLSRRAVVSSNGDGLQDSAVAASKLKVSLKTLILHVTEACNLRCAYCYHAEGGKGGEQEEHRPAGLAMSPEMAERAVDFLFEESGALDEVVIVFFGGEPLLNLETIRFVVDRATARADAAGKKVSFALTTNGTMLSDEVARFLDQKGIGVTVSMDGFEEVHDRYRRFPDESPSYEVILPRVKGLLRTARNRPVVARVTVAHEPDRVGQVFEHLLGLGFVEVGFAPVTTGHPDFQLNEQGMDRLLAEFKDLAEDFIRAAREGRVLGFSNLIDLLVSLHQGEVMNYPCGAGLGLFSVDPRGELYLCQRFTGQESFRMGDVFNGFDQERLDRFRDEAEISNKEACKNCWARTICSGGCYHEACVREGSHLRPNLHYCEWIQRWGEVGLQTYCRIAADRPKYLDMLCASRGYPLQNDA
jgi:uncharacterized protein